MVVSSGVRIPAFIDGENFELKKTGKRSCIMTHARVEELKEYPAEIKIRYEMAQCVLKKFEVRNKKKWVLNSRVDSQNQGNGSLNNGGDWRLMSH
jgi:hypothetical protein